MTAVLWTGAPASAQSTVDARSAALSSSATCTFGDIEITYTGTGVERQVTTFSEAGDVTHHYFDVWAYTHTHDGLEYILSQTEAPPPAGAVMAVHTTIGTSPPSAETTGEFIVVYQCDPLANAQGGNNVVLATCAGPYGTCFQTAEEYLASIGQGSNPPAAAAVVTPVFSG